MQNCVGYRVIIPFRFVKPAALILLVFLFPTAKMQIYDFRIERSAIFISVYLAQWGS